MIDEQRFKTLVASITREERRSLLEVAGTEDMYRGLPRDTSKIVQTLRRGYCAPRGELSRLREIDAHYLLDELAESKAARSYLAREVRTE